MDKEKFAARLREMNTMMGGNQAVIKKLADHVLQEFPRKTMELRDIITQGDAEKVRTMAHALKGSIANFGAEEARSLAYQLETMGKNKALAKAPEALRLLEHELQQIYAFFSDPGWLDNI